MWGWVRRWSYRFASRVLRAYRVVRRPTVRGVRCVLMRRHEVLLVRHTYGDRRWALPGGLPKRREVPMEAARREVREELELDLSGWRDLGEIRFVGSDRAHHVVRCFAVVVAGADPVPEPGEIADARWFPVAGLPTDLLDGTGEIVALAARIGSPA